MTGPVDPTVDRVGEPIQRATDLTGTLVLKHDRCFLLSDAFGDVRRDQRGLGLYLGDTRVLSRYELRLDGQRPVVLRTSGSASWRGTIQMTNPDLARNPMDKGDAAAVLSRQSLGIVRERIIADAFEERIRVHNYTLHPERCLLTLGLDADFADIFEVRGRERAAPRRAPADGGHARGSSGSATPASTSGSGGPGSRSPTPARRAGVAPAEDPDGVGSGRAARHSTGASRRAASGSLDIRVTSEVLRRAACRPRRQHGRPAAPLASDEPEAAHRAWHATSTTVSSTARRPPIGRSAGA